MFSICWHNLEKIWGLKAEVTKPESLSFPSNVARKREIEKVLRGLAVSVYSFEVAEVPLRVLAEQLV